MMNKLNLICLFLLMIVTDLFANNSDFYESGREILGEMVAIESTEAMGLASTVSEYAGTVLLDNGFTSADIEARPIASVDSIATISPRISLPDL